MAREKFVEHSFNKSSLALIGTCSGILEEYRKQGYRLGRPMQLFFQKEIGYEIGRVDD